MLVYKAIFLAFIIHYSNYSSAQEFYFKCSATDEQLQKATAVISDDEGNVLFERAFTQEEITNGVAFKYDNWQNQRIHFTEIYEFGDSLMNASRIIKAITYYDIDSTFDLTSSFSNLKYSGKRAQPLQIIVDDAREVDVVHYYFPPGRFKNLVRDRNALKVNLFHQPDEDLFLIFQCQTAPYDRYVYVPSGEVKDNLYINLLNLPSELQEINIPLPEKQQWFGNIQGTNLLTNSICHFYSSDRDPLRVDKLKILVPTDQKFEDFDIQIGFETTSQYFRKKMVYKGLNKTSFTIPEFDESLYNIYDLVKTPEEIGFTISETPDLFQINMGRDLMPMDTSNNCAIGQWSIIGKNDNEVAFKFPKMSNGLLDISNPSLGVCGWYYAGIHLIKVLDKNDVPDNDLLINYLNFDRLTVSLWHRY